MARMALGRGRMFCEGLRAGTKAAANHLMPDENLLPHILKHITLRDALLIFAVIVAARFAAALVKWAFTTSSGRTSASWRIRILRWMPLARLAIVLGAASFIVPMLIVPSWQNIVGLAAGLGLVFAFAMKDYGSCLLAGLVTIFERTYQPGDWIEIGGAYGEVRSIGVRAVCIVTLDDTEVIIPHAKIWSSSVSNATSGNHTVLCVADFYLHPEHDGLLVRERLTAIALASPFLLPGSAVKVTASEQPWGTHYRVKAYAKDSREQKQLTTDITLRSKPVFRELGIPPALARVAPATAVAH